MNTVSEIEAAIAKLPLQEFHTLARWIDEHRAAWWDRQMEEDAKNSNLDKLYARLMAENGDGPKIPLHEVLDDAQLP